LSDEEKWTGKDKCTQSRKMARSIEIYDHTKPGQFQIKTELMIE